ncbi:MAG: tRNA (adenine(22)-N(1))-methyltransferase TrmK [Lachnospiraceae bacterium]|nr:tRNA (adenine(22)-N(1))-methyltransferase TrmK [Lachnospiraceae bacterium]
MALLSERLKAVAGMITPGLPVADIGCDHAYLPIYLARENISPYIIACDINAGPIVRAQENVEDADLSERIDVRQGDGLSVINAGEVKSVILAGMGGRLMMRILEDGSDILSGVDEIIMEPQSEVAGLRHYLQDKGFRIISENMVSEDDKFYPIIKAVHGRMDWDLEIYFRYGKILLREENPVLHEFLLKEKEYCSKLLVELSENEDIPHVFVRMEEVKTDLALNTDALHLVSEPGLFEKNRVIS